MRWKKVAKGKYMCPDCGTRWNVSTTPMEKYHFCPNCGGNMDDAHSVFAVTRSYSFDSDTSVNVFPTESAAQEYLMAEYFNYLCEELRENPEGVNAVTTGIGTDSYYAAICWLKEPDDKMELAVSEVCIGEADGHELRVSDEVLYELYKRDWCNARGWNYADVQEAEQTDTEYQGQMYVCFDEFMDAERKDDGYIIYLLSNVELIHGYLRDTNQLES